MVFAPASAAYRDKDPDAKSVVIVDDSATMRSILRVVIDDDPKLNVIGEADSALQAREVIKETNPDVVTLDIEMPGMSGLEFLEKLMRLRPTPVVMISSATRANSEATITALSLGAVDCILKPTTLIDPSVRKDMTRRIVAAANSSVQQLAPVVAAPKPVLAMPEGPLPLILVGSSTGGVVALERMLMDLPADGPPVVIVQHMPGNFLESFSSHLNNKLPQSVALAREDEVLDVGHVRLAPAEGRHTSVYRRGTQWRCRFTPKSGEELHCPSVDTLFASAVSEAEDVIAVILTGLGRDGAEAMLRLHQAGTFTLGQDEASSVVYGMPKAAWELGAIDRQMPIATIGSGVTEAVAAYRKRMARKTR
ncbi:MAG: chemotaxis-specific protein-glutamate methyltransferase CheB [Pseudomonadota bacterium]